MKRMLGAMLLALPLTAAGGISLLSTGVYNVYAGEPTYYEGAQASGVIVAESGCPVEVEREIVTLHLPELPDPAEIKNYGAYAKTEYLFYNPTENDVTMRLMLPCSEAGGYDCPAECRVSVEGETAECDLRHTYYYGTQCFEKIPGDGRQEDAFFTQQLPVSELTYRYENAGSAGKYFHLVLDFNPARTRVLLSGAAKTSIEDGKIHAVWQAEERGEVCVYVLGEPVRSSDYSFSDDAGGSSARSGGGLRLTVDERKTTFSELAEELRPQAGSVSENDWYNGFVDMLNAKSRYGVAYLSPNGLSESHFMRWYGYEVTVPAGGRTESAVTVPVYPTIDTREGKIYRYSYLLSASQRWANVKSLEIRLETPYYISDSSLKFEATDTGYYLSREGLPLGELTFALTEAELLRGGGFDPVDVLVPKLVIAIAVASVLIVGGAVAVICVLTVGAGKRKRAEAARMGTPEEGNLPPERDDAPKGE